MESLDQPRLLTERLVATPFAPGEAKELLDVFRNAEVRRYLLDDHQVELDWVIAEINASANRFTERGLGLFSLRLRTEKLEAITDDPIVGFAGFRPFHEPAHDELLYGLLPRCWGRGLATEIGREMLRYARVELGHGLIRASIDEPNRASGRVLERLGFRFVRKTVEDGLATLHFEHSPDDSGRTGSGLWSDSKTTVLFVCTHNSARSQLAEGLLRLGWGSDFSVQSAGTEPRGLHAVAAKVLEEVGIDPAKHWSKTIDEATLGITPDVVVTVCDNAREACPYVPARHTNLHRSFTDPSAGELSHEERLEAFRSVREEIREWLASEVHNWRHQGAAKT